MSLTGSSKAEDRAAIIRQAKRAASTYYGETCIDVTLSNETYEEEEIRIGPEIVRTSVAYAAKWEAKVEHLYDQPTYGPAICRGCKKEKWPHR